MEAIKQVEAQRDAVLKQMRAIRSINGEGEHYETILEGPAQGEKGVCFAGTILCHNPPGREQDGRISLESGGPRTGTGRCGNA